MNAGDQLNHAKRIMDMMALGDTDALHKLLHPAAQWHVPPSVARIALQPSMKGPDAICAMIKRTHATFFDKVSFKYLKAVEQDDHVFLLCRLDGTTLIGPRYTNDYAVLIRFADGLAVEGWEFTDTAHSFDLMNEAGGLREAAT